MKMDGCIIVLIQWAQHHLQWILQCQQNISISKIIRIICQITRQDHGYTHSLSPDAAKEIGANMGSSLGSSINISTDAGAQLASDLGKGVIQGVSQYISKRMRTVRVHLKSGYRVLLYQEK